MYQEVIDVSKTITLKQEKSLRQHSLSSYINIIDFFLPERSLNLFLVDTIKVLI